MTDGDALRVVIESTRGPDDEPVCLLTYGPHTSYPSVAEVRQTALDLLIAAADAEACVLLAGLGLPPEAITAFVEDLLRQRKQASYGTDATISLRPAASTKQREAYVLIQRKDAEGVLTAAEAREMAGHWFQVAGGTEQDQLFAEALRMCTKLTGIQVAQVYEYVSALRNASD